MKKMIIAVAILMLARIPDSLGDGHRTPLSSSTRLFGTIEYFEWKEFGEGGERLLKESGPLYGIGAEMSLPLIHSFVFDARGQIFFGDIDYDGAIQTPEGDKPYKSSTSYSGYEVEGLLGYLWGPQSEMHLKPYAGMGLRDWQRTLDTDFSDEFIGPWGYVENWAVWYWIAGLEGGLQVGRNGTIFCRLEGRWPYDISEKVDLSNADQPSDISVDPDKRASFHGEVGYEATPWLIAMYVETQIFGQSEFDKQYNTFSQPKSESTILGAKLGISF